jgi:hypothetical protein
MRRLLFLVMLIVAIGAVAPSASASASSDIDGVTGVGTLGQLGDPTVRVSAVQIGSAAIGRFQIRYPDRTFATGRATCLFVAGNTAYLTGRIIRSGGPRSQVENWLHGSYIVIGVQDNGRPGTAAPDELNFSPGFATNPGCGPNAAATPGFPIVRGNYVLFGHAGGWLGSAESSAASRS